MFAVASVGCGASTTGTAPSRTAEPGGTTAITSRAPATFSPAPTATAQLEATSTPTPPEAGLAPVGFPVDPGLHADKVVGAPGSREIAAGAGPTVQEYSRRDQSSEDPERANASGWDCRVHVEYEGSPAVDWYVHLGQPVRATMDGLAVLTVNTTVNTFDYYGVSREPYLGNPDRAHAPVNQFPGPSGGMGVYVSVVNEEFRTDYGHLELQPTIANVPDGGFIGGYSRGFDYPASRGVPRNSGAGDRIAMWRVGRGDIVGYTGDTGYSEGPHLHYRITRLSDGARLCPTSEAAFHDSGWLWR